MSWHARHMCRASRTDRGSHGSLGMDYVSDNFGEMPMSSVRCSMEVLSVRLFCPRSVSGTG